MPNPATVEDLRNPSRHRLEEQFGLTISGASASDGRSIGMSQNRLAHAIGVPGNRIHAIVNGTRVITGDTDLRLCKFFGLSEGYFLRLQNAYDTLEAKRRIAAQLAKIKPYKPKKAA